ncbi:beta-D-glucosyl crocetin beta-1,6-glucosyltransferase-like [Rhododendron vialii]|uniref:beta-D-glucosyl crocetin beta-1,6-glucosyltransferase-like n=1 Tax=Rhododendron vialii TaxID=182163 RepID=UPI00265DFE3A|nr:beta-D-glucosyl crocetin beta-1,6-glucosyltransferase-like [Rhododendron vialii]
METRKGSISVLMLPWLAHGHISSFLELAKRLTETNFFIYFCSTCINLNSVKKMLPEKYSPSIQLVELHLPSSPELPPHLHTTNGLPPHLMRVLKIAFEESKPFFSHVLNTLNPDLIMYDFNMPWVSASASLLNIPSFLFFTFGSLFTSFAFHFMENPDAEYPVQSIQLHESEKTSLKAMLEFSANGVKDGDLIRESIKLSRDVVLIKTSTEIEEKYIDYLSMLVKKKVQPVGLLVQEIVDKDDDTEVMRFLHKKDESSVVFVAFGSEFFLSDEEREEIAYGLELSRVNFIWVVRFPVGEKTTVEEALPVGFLDRVGDLGMVVEGWAPQAKILTHPSTGGFMSHCGWNSVLESIKFGIPIIAMPMHLDQPLNARLVEEVGVGVGVKRDETGRLDRKEIAIVVRRIVVEKHGMEVRNKARELSGKMAMKEVEEIDEVVEEMVKLSGKRK